MKDQSKTKNARIQKSTSLNEAGVYTGDIINTVHEPLIILDHDLRVITASRSFYEVFKVKPEETMGQLIYNMGNKQWDIPKLRELLEDILPQKITLDNYKVQHDFAAIGQRTMLLNARQIKRAFGKERIILLAIEDITKRRQTEDIYKTLMEKSLVAVFIVQKGKFRFINTSAIAHANYDSEELVGRDADTIVYPEDRAMVKEKGRAMLRGEHPAPYEFRMVTKNGQIRWIMQIVSPIEYEGNMAILGNAMDITERRHAEEALQKSEEQYRALVENASDVVFRTDSTGRFTFVNPAMLSITGYSEEEIIGKHYKILFRPDKYKEVMKALVGQYENRIQNTYQEFPILTKDGHEKWIGQNAQLIVEDDHVIGFQAVARDITERKSIEEALRQSEEKYRTILESIQEGYFEVDLTGNFTFSNDSMSRLIGCSKEELQGMNYKQFTNEETAKEVFHAFNEVYTTGKPSKAFDWQVIRKNGDKRYIEASVSLQKDSSDKPTGFKGMVRDVTERKREEEIIRQSEERYRTILDEMADAYYEVDITGNYTFVNDALCRQLGQSKEELLGTNVRVSIDKEDIKTVYNAFNRIYTTGKPEKNISYKIIRKNGTIIFIENSGFPLKNKKGEIIGFRGIGRDITERKQSDEKIEYLATHDTLTGLPNRSMFSQLLNYAIKTAHRYQRQFAVLFIDLDRFKIINDTLGHDAGDQLLQEIAARLKQSLRTVDVVGRLGGDEFVILIEEVSDSTHIATVAHKILASIMKPFTLMGQESRITASIGISMYPKDALDEQSLMKNADIAMYMAKEEGKNNYQFYSADIQSKSLERLSIETNLRFALERNELSLHYQAKVDFKTDMITGVEALLRWQNPFLGSVTPTQFIPVAEETGLIVSIGRWVLKTACAQNVAWQKQGLPAVSIAVNLSPRQFMDDTLLDDIRTALYDSGMAPNLLELEITESVVMHNPAHIISLLSKIKSMGVRLAIDDFGTGYSSLAQIKHFPVDTLKVDRSFIRNIPQDAEDKAITEAIIAMGKTLSLTVVAEGVENEEQINFLKEHSCDEMQGYFFSKPVLPEQFADLLREHVPSPPEWKKIKSIIMNSANRPLH
jgi:diguanylate cyclase (GGDEF)-like protein/PAS domain S-box-containing protein